MSDQQNPALIAQAPKFAAPPTQPASQFLITANAMELLVTVGYVRVAPQPNNTAIPMIEWWTTLSLSPVAAKQFHETLGDALQQYEKLFGKIPADPNLKRTVQITGPDQAATPPGSLP